MEFNGWGRYPKIQAKLVEPIDSFTIKGLLKECAGKGQLIAQGARRSYGDSCLAENIVGSRFLDNFISFDRNNGTIACGAGVTLDQILEISVPAGWFLPVLPGTRFVTAGGAIASDVHGKNHHTDGCFSSFVNSITLMLASGEIVQCGSGMNDALFHATCGGMGLTGIILQASLKLERISSAFIEQRTEIAGNLDEILELFDKYADSKYSVAWIDCLARGSKLGRSVLLTGEHTTRGDLVNWDRTKVSAPSRSPGFLINRHSMKLFNNVYYALQKSGRRDNILHYRDYFFPLDWIRHWNRLYGKAGFIQYQFVVPQASAKESLTAVLREISSQGKGSFLSVLKKMGAENNNYLSFPMAGYTLALDFKVEDSLFPLLDRLDQIVMDGGGRVYLAKDARMKESMFKQTYPRWQQFCQVRQDVDPTSLFGSLQSRRLGLSE